jgi:outer membrane protein TolC
MMKKTIMPLLTLLFLSAALMLPQPASAVHEEGGRSLPVVRVGTVVDGPWARKAEVIDTFREEISTILEGEYDVQFPEAAALDGGWSRDGVKSALDRLLGDSEVDVVLALGRFSSYLAATRGDPGKPVVASFIVSAEAQGLPWEDGASGVANLNYIEAFNTLPRDLQTFREIVHFDSLAIISDRFIAETVPDLAEYVRVKAGEYADRVTLIQVETSADEALKQIPESVDAVVVTPLPRVSDEEFKKLVNGLVERGLPGYSTRGRNEVEAGLLASMTPRSSLDSLARSTAVNVHDILRGIDAGSLSVAFDPGQQFTINMATARAIDVYPSLLVMTAADLLHEERTDIDRVLTLQSAVREALTANLDLLTADHDVAAGAQAVRQRLSDLLPQVDLASRALVIDEDRAAASGGQAPEKTWTGSVGASQLIYSDRTWSKYTIERHFQQVRESLRQALGLDISLATAITFLNVKRAEALERIQEENLRLTRANLARARIRVEVGIAGPEEIYRWESELAAGRQKVLNVQALTVNTRTGLNRLLNRPLQEEFVLRDVPADEADLALVKELFTLMVEDRKAFKVTRDYMVMQGQQISPDLQSLDAEITARKRTVKTAKRAFWLPDFSFRADVDELFSENGAGQRGQHPADLDSTEWAVGVFASIPIFNSGGKMATLRREKEELEAIETERAAVAEREEERVTKSFNLTRAAYPGIQLSQEAAEAARKNLELVTDSYERGIKSIIDLLDAQNQALVSNEGAANSGYDFLAILMRLQRAIGKFDFLLTDEEREEWHRVFKEYAEERGVSLTSR